MNFIVVGSVTWPIWIYCHVKMKFKPFYDSGGQQLKKALKLFCIILLLLVQTLTKTFVGDSFSNII